MKTITTTLLFGDVPEVSFSLPNESYRGEVLLITAVTLTRSGGDRLNEAVLSIMEFKAISGFRCHKVTASMMSSHANLQSSPEK